MEMLRGTRCGCRFDKSEFAAETPRRSRAAFFNFFNFFNFFRKST